MLCPVCIFMKQVLTLLSVFKCVFFCTTMVSRPSHFFLAVMVTRCRDTVCQYYALLAAYLKTAKQRHFVIGVTDQQPFHLLFSLNQIYQQTISKLVCAGLLENPGVIIWTFGQWGGVGVSDKKKIDHCFEYDAQRMLSCHCLCLFQLPAAQGCSSTQARHSASGVQWAPTSPCLDSRHASSAQIVKQHCPLREFLAAIVSVSTGTSAYFTSLVSLSVSTVDSVHVTSDQGGICVLRKSWNVQSTPCCMFELHEKSC